VNWVSNKCGGARFRTLPDYRIEVEGHGIPKFDAGSASLSQLKQTWKNWKWYIRFFAKKTGLPPSYLLAIATKETGLWSADKKKQASIGSPAGAQGIMQIMPCHVFQNGPWGKLVCGRDRSSPYVSFDIASVILKQHLKNYGGLPAAASGYNSGSLRCYSGQHEANVFNWHHEHNYAFKVAQFNNSAIENLNVNSNLWMWISGGVATFGLLAASGGEQRAR
jgi:hypothetical protein